MLNNRPFILLTSVSHFKCKSPGTQEGGWQFSVTDRQSLLELSPRTKAYPCFGDKKSVSVQQAVGSGSLAFRRRSLNINASLTTGY
jgi:hypothetical protein